MKELPILIVDTREKNPFDYEGDDAFASIEHTKLDGGDYSIKGMEHIIVVERKASVDELFVNFTKDKERIQAEFERLANIKFRVLVVEESLEDIMNPGKYYINAHKINKQSPKMPVAVVISGLTNLMLQHNVHIIFGGDRSQAMVRGILLRAYELYKKGLL